MRAYIAGPLFNEGERWFDEQIDAIARQFDITNDADKTAFQNAVRAAVDNPVFSDSPFALFMSAGRPDGFGGPGGPGRGPGRGFGR